MKPEELENQLAQYLDHRESLRYRQTHHGVLTQFAWDYAIEHPGEPVRVDHVLSWIMRVPRAPQTQFAVLGTVRGFLRFVQVADPATALPNDHLLRSPIRTPPFIWNAEQLRSILEAAANARPRGGLRANAYVTVLGLLASSGLRIGEALRLEVSDGIWTGQCLTSSCGKHVSPHVIRHTTAMHLLQSGVDMSVIALWLGHEHLDTTHIYMEADLALKEKALNRLQPARQAAPRFRATDKVAQVKHVFVKAAARMSNRAENSHQPSRRRERQMCGFRDARRILAFLSCVGPIRQHFALPRHQMNAVCHRAILKERLATWHGWTDSPAANEVI